MKERRAGRRKGKKAVRAAPKDLSRAVDQLSFRSEEPQRLDRFLAGCLDWRSRTSILELLAEQQVQVNDEVITRKAFRLKAGDRVSVAVPPPPEPERHEELAAQLEAAIVFEDDDLLAINKPAGLVMHPVGRIRVNTLIQALHWRFQHGAGRGQSVFGGSRPGEIGPVVPRICHRLDRDTSGVVLFAKNVEARTSLQLLMERDKRHPGELEKVYLACVHGAPDPPTGRVELPIGVDPERERGLVMCVRDDGSKALTTYEPAPEGAPPGLSWVRFRIHTGRQHQIRVHARAIGHPILCDAVYGRGETRWPTGEEGAEPSLARQALHAWRLVLPHPRTSEELELRAPLPADLQSLVV